MWTWIFIAAGYVAALFGFRLLGGFSAAGGAITTWGQRSSARRRAAIEHRLGLRR